MTRAERRDRRERAIKRHVEQIRTFSGDYMGMPFFVPGRFAKISLFRMCSCEMCSAGQRAEHKQERQAVRRQLRRDPESA